MPYEAVLKLGSSGMFDINAEPALPTRLGFGSALMQNMFLCAHLLGISLYALRFTAYDMYDHERQRMEQGNWGIGFWPSRRLNERQCT